MSKSKTATKAPANKPTKAKATKTKGNTTAAEAEDPMAGIAAAAGLTPESSANPAGWVYEDVAVPLRDSSPSGQTAAALNAMPFGKSVVIEGKKMQNIYLVGKKLGLKISAARVPGTDSFRFSKHAGIQDPAQS